MRPPLERTTPQAAYLWKLLSELGWDDSELIERLFDHERRLAKEQRRKPRTKGTLRALVWRWRHGTKPNRANRTMLAAVLGVEEKDLLDARHKPARRVPDATYEIHALVKEGKFVRIISVKRLGAPENEQLEPQLQRKLLYAIRTSPTDRLFT